MSTDVHSNGSPENPNAFTGRSNFSLSQKKNNEVEAKRNRGNRGKDQLPPPAAKRTNLSAGSGKKSQNDLVELVAQTYAKGISILHQKHNNDDARGSKSLKKTKKKNAGKGSVQKKTPQIWSAKDEMALVNALLACAGEEGQLNISAFYEKAKETLGFTVSSNTQLYDKMRSMRSRFWSIHSKLRDENIPEDQFLYRTVHEAALFKVWKQIWGNNVKEHHEEEDGHNTDQLPSQNNGDYIIRDEDHKPEESRAPVVKKMMEEVQSKIETLIDSLIRRISAATNLQPFGPGFGAEIGTGSCLCSRLSRRTKELIEGVCSVKEFPGLDEAEARTLQQKWAKPSTGGAQTLLPKLGAAARRVYIVLARIGKNEKSSRLSNFSATFCSDFQFLAVI